MTRTFQAIVENGLLKPLSTVQMPEGTRVTVTISDESDRAEESPAGGQDWPDRLRAHGPMSDGETRLVNEAMEEAFERIDPDAWR